MIERVYTPFTPQVDLTGKKYVNIKVLRHLGRYKDKSFWLVRCKCGKEYAATHGNLQSNRISRCIDCAKKILVESNFNLIHGYSNQRVYRTWRSSKLDMCERWRKSFVEFIEDMGDQPEGRYLFRSNNEPYNNENSYWGEEPNRNRKVNLIEIDGIWASAGDHAKRKGVSRQRISQLAAKKRGCCTICFKPLDGKSKTYCKRCNHKNCISRRNYIKKKEESK